MRNTNRAHYIISLCEYYEGEPKLHHKIAGVALGAAGLGAAALAGHSLATGQSPITTVGNLAHSVGDWWHNLPTSHPGTTTTTHSSTSHSWNTSAAEVTPGGRAFKQQMQQSLQNHPTPEYGQYARRQM